MKPVTCFSGRGGVGSGLRSRLCGRSGRRGRSVLRCRLHYGRRNGLAQPDADLFVLELEIGEPVFIDQIRQFAKLAHV